MKLAEPGGPAQQVVGQHQQASHLATRATDRRPAWLAHTALAYSAVRNSLLESAASSLVVILDCCYSGRALGVLGSTQDEAVDLARVHGGYVLTSAAPNELALAPEGDQYTAFTGELLNLLRNGDPDGPPQLTLRSIYRYMVSALPARGGPRPRRAASGQVDELVLASNPAYRPPVAPAQRTLSARKEFSDVCPYPGLAAFEPEQAPWFFGREKLTVELTARLASRLSEDGPLVVVAPSGTGKSSLLRAGLVPALARGDLGMPGSARWPRVVMTPGAHPLDALAAPTRAGSPERNRRRWPPSSARTPVRRGAVPGRPPGQSRRRGHHGCPRGAHR